ncbi:MAG: tRNA (adenosine(37)-N6)-threonylcarbamoyltransferase complex transferase subunit TsaD [Candidatus Uhrbacteria bacterium]|nr:tRNA (adenosine(37)-N6)-threonylcarbamoyltransferase complex transferase subunit TsaD [Candidatus Uhrbacteria bacterium]
MSRNTSKNLRILAIETSCDETAVSLVDFTKVRNFAKIRNHTIRVIKNLVSSQIPIHQKYGGVVPEVAARSHVPEIVSLLSRVVKTPLRPPYQGGQKLPPDKGEFERASAARTGFGFDAIAVTRGPGLATALRVGIEASRVLAFLSKKPIVGVNHLEGHLASAWLNATNRKHWKFPLLALIVSGGHTELVLMKNFCDYKIVGQTRDDAAGEAFDKSAKLMGLPYPGGPQIAKLAKDGDRNAFDLPRPMLKDPSLDFSFSGLKTAVRNEWLKLFPSVIPAEAGIHPMDPRVSVRLRPRMTINDFAASIQQAIIDVLIEKTMRAAKQFTVNGILLVGGVSANEELRRQMAERIKKELTDVAFLPSDKKYVTDNAAMIAAAGYWRLMKGERHDWKKMDVDPEWNV